MSAPLDELDPARWARFSLLLDEALALATPARSAWLDSLPDEDADLRLLLTSALEADSDLLAGGSTGIPTLPLDQPEPYLFESGRRFGPYEISQPLGRGGMGEVWRAHRWDDPTLRDIALKLPHSWLLGATARLRLGREKEILAGLDHPNIVRLHDAGIADDGQPWIALEHIDGQRIDEYCRDRALTLEARLALFDQVLEAMKSAHAALVVHRDLKPSNILVTAAGEVKLLDFGIAKLLDASGMTEETALTHLGGRAATLDYAAPEQLAGGTLTVAADIFSLGVVLYELLCGSRPLPPNRIGSARFRESLPLASDRIASQAHAASVGGCTPKQLRNALRGDLDAILAHAMEINPQRRYGSVESFAEDLMRHRSSEPIRARHITSLERARKFGRRHRRLLAVAALFIVTVTVGASTSWIQMVRAEREAQRANASRDFLLDILGASDRLSAADREPGSITARELLDDIVAKLDSRLADQPETQLQLLKRAAWIYRAWFQRAQTLLIQLRYRDLVLKTYGDKDPRFIQSLLDEASTQMDYPDKQGAGPLLAQADELIHKNGYQGSVLEAKWLMESARYGVPEIGASEVVIQHLQRALALYEKVAPLDADLPWTYAHLADCLISSNRLDEAYSLTRQILERQARVTVNRNDWFIATQWIRLAHIERLRGNIDASLDDYEHGDMLIMRTYGRDIYFHWEAVLWQATLLDWKGQSARAEALYVDGLRELQSMNSKPLAEATGWFKVAYAQFLIAHQRPAAALPLLQQALPVTYAQRPPRLRHADVLLSLGQAYEGLGRPDDARQAFSAANAEYEKLEHPQDPKALAARFAWIDFLDRHGDRAEVEPELREVIRLGASASPVIAAQANILLARHAETKGDTATASRLAGEALQQLRQPQALYDPKLKHGLEDQASQLIGGMALDGGG